METSLPKVFLKAVAITPVRVVLVLCAIFAGLWMVLIMEENNQPEYTKLQAAIFELEYVEPERISMPWWWLVAIPMVGFILMKSFWFLREDHSMMHLVQIFLGTILVFLPVANEIVWIVGIGGGLLFALTFKGVRSRLFKSGADVEDGEDSLYEPWIVDHLKSDSGRREVVEEGMKEHLAEQGWMQVTAVWLHSVRYVKYARNGATLVLSEQNDAPTELSGDDEVLEEIFSLFEEQAAS